MSNERQETIEDIVADIRAQNQGLPEDSYALSPLVCDLLSLADRIEAALSEPLRNCDVYTVGEALRKYGFPTKIKPWGEKEWLDFCEWLVSEVEGEGVA